MLMLMGTSVINLSISWLSFERLTTTGCSLTLGLAEEEMVCSVLGVSDLSILEIVDSNSPFTRSGRHIGSRNKTSV